jgi:outer membrane protein OmpA-like peptidoglycan-associated protein
LHWRAPWWDQRLSLGGVFINLLSDLSGGDGLPGTLPADSQLGAAWELDPATHLEADAEFIDQAQEDALSSRGLRLGGEHWMLKGLLALRLGWAASENLPNRWSFGLGLRWRDLGLDYAFMQEVSQLGDNHRFSASWRFGLPARAVAELQPTAVPTRAASAPAALSLSARAAVPEPATLSASALPVSPTPAPVLRLGLEVEQIVAGGGFIFRPQLEGDTLAARSWSLEICDAAGATLWARQGPLPLPGSWSWNGKDSLGAETAPGEQVAHLKLWGAEQALASADARFQLALQAASLELVADPALFSPTPGSMRPEARLAWRLRGAVAQAWDWKILDARGRLVASAHGQGSPAQPLRWDGRWQRRRLPQGPYRFELRIQAAGHAKRLKASASVQLDPTRLEPQLAAESQVFDAEEAGPQAVRFIPGLASPAGLEAWTLDVSAGDGQAIRRLQGHGELPTRILWDGLDAEGKAVAPGQLYSASLAVTAKSGAQGRSESLPLQADVRAFHESTAIRVPLTSLAFAAGALALSPEQMASLKAAGEAAQRYGEHYLIQVKGYAGQDEATPGVSALQLSSQRARLAADYLAEAVGLPREALSSAGYGVVNEAGGAGDPARLRRVDVILCTR